MKKPFFPITLTLVFHRGDHMCCLGRQNLITSDSSPKVHRQNIPTNCANSVLSSSPFIKWIVFRLSTLFSFYKQPVYEQLTLGT